MVQLRREMLAGRAAAFTVDGPRGPARRVQPGAVWLSRLTGNPILPFHIEASAYWSMSSWDQTQVPKPYGLSAVAVGSPLTVAPDASDADVERTRVELERRLIVLGDRATEMVKD